MINYHYQTLILIINKIIIKMDGINLITTITIPQEEYFQMEKMIVGIPLINNLKDEEVQQVSQSWFLINMQKMDKTYLIALLLILSQVLNINKESQSFLVLLKNQILLNRIPKINSKIRFSKKSIFKWKILSLAMILMKGKLIFQFKINNKINKIIIKT